MTRPSSSPRHAPPSRRSTLWPGVLIALIVAGGGVWLVNTLAERPTAATPMAPAMPGMDIPSATPPRW